MALVTPKENSARGWQRGVLFSRRPLVSNLVPLDSLGCLCPHGSYSTSKYNHRHVFPSPTNKPKTPYKRISASSPIHLHNSHSNAINSIQSMHNTFSASQEHPEYRYLITNPTTCAIFIIFVLTCHAIILYWLYVRGRDGRAESSGLREHYFRDLLYITAAKHTFKPKPKKVLKTRRY